MRKAILVLFSVLGFGLLIWAQQPRLTASSRVVLTEDTRLASQVLPAGTYAVTHLKEGAEHIMIFTQNGKEFRVSCNLVETDGNEATTYYYRDSVRQQPVLLWIEFRGDHFRYVFTK